MSILGDPPSQLIIAMVVVSLAFLLLIAYVIRRLVPEGGLQGSSGAFIVGVILALATLLGVLGTIIFYMVEPLRQHVG